MDNNEQNDDEMILVVVGDEDGIMKYEISESQPDMLVPINAKMEPSAENVKEIFATAVKHEEFKVEPAVEGLDEKYLLQEYLEEYTQDDTETTETNVSLNKRTPRKTRHKYLLDEDFISLDVSPKKKRRKTNVSPKTKKRKTNVSQKLKPKPKQPQNKVKNIRKNPEDFLEIEFLEDDNSLKTPESDENSFEVEFLEEPPEELVPKKEEDEEYIPEEQDQEEEYDEDFIEEEKYVPPKGKRKPKTPSKKSPKTTRKVHAKKEERPINSFILELCEDPHFKENVEDLVEYLVDYMRKRTAPPPPPDYYHLDDDNMYR